MEPADNKVFTQLYHDAFLRCFKNRLQQPLSETESKIFQNQILESTGLTVGWRSLKNYSLYVIQDGDGRFENPSIATLDTLARYVVKAPYTNEISRKNDEGHHPYWFLYKSRVVESPAVNIRKRNGILSLVSFFILIIVSISIFLLWHLNHQPAWFKDNFEKLDDSTLLNNGWSVFNKDNVYWAKRNSHQNALTLFTLPGDNWPDTVAKPSIKNLLIRKLSPGCFSAELQLESFIPSGEWQQAGLLLMADTSFNGPSIRISLGYNDYFGGNQRPKEIIVQAISSLGNESKPEEFIHYKAFSPDSAAKNPLLFSNLKHTALRIEKQGYHYRFLFSAGAMVTEAFKELSTKDLMIEPRYLALFALKGRVKSTPVVPVIMKKFILRTINCQ